MEQPDRRLRSWNGDGEAQWITSQQRTVGYSPPRKISSPMTLSWVGQLVKGGRVAEQRGDFALSISGELYLALSLQLLGKPRRQSTSQFLSALG
jgi:hypothetical protein